MGGNSGRPPIAARLIKGISDVVEDRGKTGVIRNRWKLFASQHAAAFARELVNRCHELRRPTPIERIVPASISGRVQLNNHCCGVLHGVAADQYSALAVHNLPAIEHAAAARVTSAPQLFTVFAYDPKTAYEITLNRYRYYHPRFPTPTPEQLTEWADRAFKHFAAFNALAAAADSPTETATSAVVRILLVDDLESFADELAPEHWRFFLHVNHDVPCWAIGRRDMESESSSRFLTDHVVLGGRLVLDYYNESSVLVVSDLHGTNDDSDLLSLYRLFAERRGRSPFRSLADLKNQVETALGRRQHRRGRS